MNSIEDAILVMKAHRGMIRPDDDFNTAAYDDAIEALEIVKDAMSIKQEQQEDIQIDCWKEVLKSVGKGTLKSIAVYGWNQVEYPGKYVARMFIGSTPTRYVIVAEKLEEIRITIPLTMNKIERMKEDDPSLIEVWI